MRFFEPRTPDSINVLQTVKGLTALDIHPQANLFAWSVESADARLSSWTEISDLCSLRSSGSMNQFIAVYNANGDVISNIKYYDGFMGQRIGAISCLAFHPFWVKPPLLSIGPSSRGLNAFKTSASHVFILGGNQGGGHVTAGVCPSSSSDCADGG